MTVTRVTDPQEALVVARRVGFAIETEYVKPGDHGVQGEKWDTPFMARYLSEAAGQETVRFYVLWDDDRMPRGYLVGYVMPDPKTGLLMGSEYLWVVEKSARRGGAGLRLMDKFIEDCREAGCKSVNFGSVAGTREGELLGELYLMLGFKPSATVYSKAI
jgi:GNAT superfamily N-acetyltransferase